MPAGQYDSAPGEKRSGYGIQHHSMMLGARLTSVSELARNKSLAFFNQPSLQKAIDTHPLCRDNGTTRFQSGCIN
jgi:hypothetical protein